MRVVQRIWNREFDWLAAGLGVTCLIGWLFKAHCGAGWSGWEQYTTGCYSDIVPFWGIRGVAAGQIPYFQARMEYPVLTGGLIWIEGGVTRILFGATRANAAHFLGVATAVNALLALGVMWMFWRAGMPRDRLLRWCWAPPLLLYVGHNWDLLAIGFAVAAVLQTRAGHPVRGAALAGLGVAAKLFPILLLPMIGLGALFKPGASWRHRLVLATQATAAAVAAWVAVNLPVALVAPENWSEFYRFSSERAGTSASVWELLATVGGWAISIPARNLYSLLLFVAGFAAIIAFGWRRHAAHPWVLFTPVLAWFLLTNKVYSPQFDLWLYPLLILTAPRIAPVLLFAAADMAAYFMEFWYFAGLEGAWPDAAPVHIALAATLRAAAIAWTIADALRLPAPQWLVETDPVPMAGPLSGA